MVSVDCERGSSEKMPRHLFKVLTGFLLLALTAGAVWLIYSPAHWLTPFTGAVTVDEHPAQADLYIGHPTNSEAAQDLLAADADVMALEEITTADLKIYKKEFAAKYPHVVARGTVALWSKYPVEESESVDVGFAWTRALGGRGQYAAGQGRSTSRISRRSGSAPAASPRTSATTRSSNSVSRSPQEKLAGVVVMGDFNGTANDLSGGPDHRRTPFGAGCGRFRLRVHLAGQVPDGPDPPHHGPRCRPDQGLGDGPHRQRPPTGGRRDPDLALGQAVAVGVADRLRAADRRTGREGRRAGGEGGRGVIQSDLRQHWSL